MPSSQQLSSIITQESYCISCVDSLLNCPLEIEIIVVDNASTDGSLDALQGLPHVQIIKNPTNVGFAAACNSGLRVASAPFLLFLNPDCSFEPGALAELLSVMDSDERIGMVSGRSDEFRRDRTSRWTSGHPHSLAVFCARIWLVRFSDRWPRLFFDFHLHKQPLPDQPIEVEATSGACMLIRREAMQDVGEWDEGYFLHCEDLDLCMRFRQKGWKILFVPNAKDYS